MRRGGDDGADPDEPISSSSVPSVEDDDPSRSRSRTHPRPSPPMVPPVRSWVGSGSVQLSDWINDHLIVARPVAFASIGLLAAYGLSHSPLLFRYRTVSDIPARSFQNRRTLVGRLIRVSTAEPTATVTDMASASREGLIIFQIRHLSPLERFVIPGAWFDAWMRLHPSCAALGRRPDHDPHQLLFVQVAGIRTSAPQYSWLEAWAATQPVVRVQLLARRVPPPGVNPSRSTLLDDKPPTRLKRGIPGFSELSPAETPSSWNGGSSLSSSSSSEQVAVAKVRFRTRPRQFWPTADLAEFLARTGRAAVEDGDDGLLARSDPRDRITDASASVAILKKDAAYLVKLGHAEYEAARGSHGMWADPAVRRRRPDVVDEVEFQETAPWWKKLWRWIQGG